MSLSKSLSNLVNHPISKKNLDDHGSLWGKTEYVANFKYQIGKLEIGFTWKRRSNFMGRFGGGWNWRVGATWGKTDLIIYLLVCQLRLRVDK